MSAGTRSASDWNATTLPSPLNDGFKLASERPLSAPSMELADIVDALAVAPKPKVDPAVARALSAEAQGVIVCIKELGTA